MTTLLEQAFQEAAKLPADEQDVLAEDDFDRTIAGTGGKLAQLAHEALAEHRAGQTEVIRLS